MYGGAGAEAGAGREGEGGAEELSSPSLGCSMWASMQPYPRYGVQAAEGVAYQPFAAHFAANAAAAATVAASVVAPHCPAAVAMATRPQADLGVYNAAAAAAQRALPVTLQASHPSSSSSTSSTSSSSSSSPTVPGLGDRQSHQSPYPRKAASPPRPQREFSVYPPQGCVASRDASYQQYHMGLSSAGTHWGD